MSSIRNHRTRLAGAAATLALAALAALSLTACTDATGASDKGASAGTTTTTPPSPAAPAAKGSTAGGSSSPSTTGPAASPPADTVATQAPASPGKPVTCEGSTTKVAAAPLNRPVNHMLLTVTNTGSRACYLYTYPALRFGEAQSVPPAIADSQPQAVVTLDPGESGYASVSLSAGDGSGSNGHTEKSLAVYFHGRTGNESVGAGAHPPLPAKGVHIDDSLRTTYWQQSMDDALTW